MGVVGLELLGVVGVLGLNPLRVGVDSSVTSLGDFLKTGLPGGEMARAGFFDGDLGTTPAASSRTLRFLAGLRGAADVVPLLMV